MENLLVDNKVLKEKGIEIERVQLDINALEPKSEAFTQKNPMQTVPALELDDGTVISETIAICRYFEEIQPDPLLFGKTPLEKAVNEMWQRRMEFHFLLPVANVFRHAHPAMADWEKPQIKEFSDANRPKVLEFLSWLDTELADRQFIAGDAFTIADITAIAAADFMKPARLEIPETLTNVLRWYGEMKERPSYRA